MPVYAINPNAETVEGQVAYAELAALPQKVHGISVITPPEVTETIVEQAGELGIEHLWLQPGSESDTAMQRARELGLNVIAGGPCALVVLRFRDDASA